jgi:hypothetical protein
MPEPHPEARGPYYAEHLVDPVRCEWCGCHVCDCAAEMDNDTHLAAQRVRAAVENLIRLTPAWAEDEAWRDANVEFNAALGVLVGRLEQKGEALHEAVMLTLARSVGHFDDYGFDEHVPQAIVDSLYDRKLMEPTSDVTGEAGVRLTEAGEAYLEALLAREALGVPPPREDNP